MSNCSWKLLTYVDIDKVDSMMVVGYLANLGVIDKTTSALEVAKAVKDVYDHHGSEVLEFLKSKLFQLKHDCSRRGLKDYKIRPNNRWNQYGTVTKESITKALHSTRRDGRGYNTELSMLEILTRNVTEADAVDCNAIIAIEEAADEIKNSTDIFVNDNKVKDYLTLATILAHLCDRKDKQDEKELSNNFNDFKRFNDTYTANAYVCGATQVPFIDTSLIDFGLRHAHQDELNAVCHEQQADICIAN